MIKPSSLLFLMVILITSGSLGAQANFSKTYLAPGLDWSITSNLKPYQNGFLLTLEEYSPVGVDHTFLRHLKIDGFGNILEDRAIGEFDFHLFTTEQNVTSIESNFIHTLVIPKKTNQPQSFGLLSLDLTTDTVTLKEYTHTSTLAGYALAKGQGDTLIMFADEVNGDDTSKWVASLTFYDTGTGVDTTISYVGSYGRPQPGEIKTLPNGDILMAFGARDYSSPPPGATSEERGILQKINANGRLLWTKAIYPGETFDFKPTILPLANGDIAYGWTKDSFSSSRPPRYYTQNPVAIFILDSMGEFKSRTMLGPIYGQLNNLERLPNGDILGMGWKGMVVEGLAGRTGWVFRLRPDGELLWERRIAYPNITTQPYLEFYDAVETPNGDLLLAGVRDLDEDKFGSWLVKLGADGCYDPAVCGGIQDTIFIYEEVVATSSLEEAEADLEIFPNPNNGTFTVRLPAAYGLQDNNILRVYDLRGREVYRQKITGTTYSVPATGLVAGVYWVRVETPAGVVRGKVVVE